MVGPRCFDVGIALQVQLVRITNPQTCKLSRATARIKTLGGKPSPGPSVVGPLALTANSRHRSIQALHELVIGAT